MQRGGERLHLLDGKSHKLYGHFVILPHLVDLDNNPKDIRAIGTTVLQVIKL